VSNALSQIKFLPSRDFTHNKFCHIIAAILNHHHARYIPSRILCSTDYASGTVSRNRPHRIFM